ncbi:retrovirus-related pol polyprotein from transposon TNT 1-94 [Tanacetum coccineum]
MVYYVEGLNHNLFSVGQFCDADLEVAFRKSTCFVRDLLGNNLLTSNRESDLYTISLQETTSPTHICFMAKALPTQAWLWHQRLSHLNFDTINLLSKKDIVVGLPKLKYVKHQLCSSCELSKATRSTFKTKAVPSLKGRINLLYMDLCGPMRIESINRKKYILEMSKASDYDNSGLAPQLQQTSNHNHSKLRSNDHNNEPSSSKLVQNVSPSAVYTAPSLQDLDLLFSPLYDEFFTKGNSSASKSFAPTDNSKQQDTQPTENAQSTTEPITPTTTVTAEENNTDIQAEIQEENTQNDKYKFYNIFSTPDELHQSDRFEVWKLVDKQFGKSVMKLKWLWTSDPPISNLEMKLFLGLQIHQSPRGIFINQVKYALDILRKHGMESCESIGTPLATKPKLDADASGPLVDQTKYRSMIGSLMYLTSSRPDIVQPIPKGYHKYGTLVSKRFCFKLTAFSDADHAGCLDTRKSTSGEIQFHGDNLVSWMTKKQDCTVMSSLEAEYVALSATLSEDRFQYLVRRIDMRCLTPAELEVLTKETA